MDLYNNKTNDRLKFKLNAEGINTNDIEPRLVFNSKDKVNYIIFGEIKEGVCYFNIPELKVYESNSKGSVKFELVSKDLYFKVWEDDFVIKTKSTIKIDEMVREISKESKPQINAILESKPIFESDYSDESSEYIEDEEIPEEQESNIEEDEEDDYIDKYDLDGASAGVRSGFVGMVAWWESTRGHHLKCGKFGKIKNKIMPFIKELGIVLRKILNIEEFKKVDDFRGHHLIIQYLITNFLPDEELSVSKTICLEKNNNIQLFVMFGKKEVFVIKDDGFNIKIIYRIEKTNFKYHIIKQDGKPKLYIEDTVTSLPININYSGDTSIVQFKIDKFIKE